jgi:hypothetical protein
MLSIIDNIPEGFLQCTATDLHSILSGPTLIHLPGRQAEPLFVSVLLHGNETTGLSAIQALLRKYQEQNEELPRALSFFVGNVAAAKHGQRHLEGQPDFNRIWPCPECDGEGPEYFMVQQVMEEMRARKVFASIDIHNNTGLNPHYGCINRLDPRFFHLAALFSRTVVYFIRPKNVQSMAFADLCPAITVECGKPDQAYGVQHAMEFIEAGLQLSHFPEHPVATHDVDLFHTVATVTVPESIRFGFAAGGCDQDEWDVCFFDDMDRLNFRELEAGTCIGKVKPGRTSPPVLVSNEAGADVTAEYFSINDDLLCTKLPVMPSMFTLDANIVRQDCLGYLMERMDLA